MSETANEPAKAEKPNVGSASAKVKDEIPAGFAACYVAIPDKVSNGKGVDAKPGEKIVGPIASIDALEMKEFAFRDEAEAKAKFTQFKRKKEAEIKEKLDAHVKREENRQRWQKELVQKELDAHQWNG